MDRASSITAHHFKLYLHNIRATMVSTPLVVAGHRVPFTSSIGFDRLIHTSVSTIESTLEVFFFFSQCGSPSAGIIVVVQHNDRGEPAVSYR